MMLSSFFTCVGALFETIRLRQAVWQTQNRSKSVAASRAEAAQQRLVVRLEQKTAAVRA
jgi:hypothetical protein